jgi:hypothetical protein
LSARFQLKRFGPVVVQPCAVSGEVIWYARADAAKERRTLADARIVRVTKEMI